MKIYIYMYLYVYIFIYIYMYTYIHMYVYLNLYICIYVYIFICMNAHAYTFNQNFIPHTNLCVIYTLCTYLCVYVSVWYMCESTCHVHFCVLNVKDTHLQGNVCVSVCVCVCVCMCVCVCEDTATTDKDTHVLGVSLTFEEEVQLSMTVRDARVHHDSFICVHNCL